MAPICYIIGPFRHRDAAQREAHILTAQRAAVDLALLGWAPYCPHTNIGHAFGQIPEIHAEAVNLAFLATARAIYLLPGWRRSVGSRREYAIAQHRKLPTFHSLAEVRAWGM